MRKFSLLIALSACFFAAGNTSAAENKLILGQRNVVAWEPSAIDGAAPLIIFSHAFGSCATQSRFLTEMLAAHGYWVVAPNHSDSRCRGANNTPEKKPPVKSFRAPEEWDSTTYRDRAEDIVAIIAAMKQDSGLKDRIDFSRIGLAGHSLGGYTVLGLGGAWPDWKIPGIKAILALSPYSRPYNTHGTLGGLSAPVMYQGGTLDFGITPFLRNPRGSYAMSPSPKYFIDFKGAAHVAWSSLRNDYHEAINAYALAFFDHYVKGQAADAALTTRRAETSALVYESDLGKNNASR